MRMHVETITRPLAQPFVITGHTFHHLNAIWVSLDDQGHIGRGEGVGMYYLNETPETMKAELESVRPAIESGASKEDLQYLLPPGGARNALDCALWDLECKTQGRSVWDMLGITPLPLVTVATVGLGSPPEMSAKAAHFADYPLLKIKLDGKEPLSKLNAIRDARPDATLVVDVNEGWTFEDLITYLPELERLSVALVEQPLPRANDEALRGFSSPIPLGGDESCRNLTEFEGAADKYDVINIKLDKCGGLTEALRMVELAKAQGKDLMVGNMTGTSLSMAPSHVVGQFCRFVDIDGPLLLTSDIENGLEFLPGGIVEAPLAELWG